MRACIARNRFHLLPATGGRSAGTLRPIGIRTAQWQVVPTIDERNTHGSNLPANGAVRARCAATA